MNGKSIATVVLLGFVAVSIGYLVMGESASQPTADVDSDSPATPADRTDSTADSGSPAMGDEATASQHKVIAYYFHNTQRCRTCRKIERLAEEALREQFGEAFDAGTLEWKTVNMEQPPNEHFVEDYQLVASTVVLVDMHDGQQRDWTNMKKVWQYVHDDEATFKNYITGQAREYLE